MCAEEQSSFVGIHFKFFGFDHQSKPCINVSKPKNLKCMPTKELCSSAHIFFRFFFFFFFFGGGGEKTYEDLLHRVFRTFVDFSRNLFCAQNPHILWKTNKCQFFVLNITSKGCILATLEFLC